MIYIFLILLALLIFEIARLALAKKSSKAISAIEKAKRLTKQNLCPDCDQSQCKGVESRSLTCPIYSVNWNKSHMGKLERKAFGIE